ncbi:unnamed protein product [Eruca vesicaria subsp. sativa]|uniref:F-box domain-containing protein n=1 Tax=Eruca vesicaria subsp. sativa TaxID=29727 RepID=A0ABC8IXV8_ERUVS|nr:unnamed protein product [Eruca vesicaria subsp. sativa]
MASPPLSLDCWSKLPLDLMQLIFEHLSFVDFERAKSVCSSWLSGSRQSKPNNKIPWMILFPEEKNYCLLFNPEDKEEKLYKTQHLDKHWADSFCLATCRSWLLMETFHEVHLYIFNLLTLERIDLPKSLSYGSDSPILWIDERSKDYLIIRNDLTYFKKGDNSWKKEISVQLSDNQNGMVFKDHKLYGLTEDELRIFDFSGEFPLQVSRVSVRGCVKLEKVSRMRWPEPWAFNQLRRRNNVVVTLRGDVLIVRSKSPNGSYSWNFRIFKMDSSNEKIKWEEIFSLGDEAIILDLGITVLAKDQEGVTSNSIYFNAQDTSQYFADIFVFNLDTKKVEQLPQVVSSVLLSGARWFLPNFKND